MVVSGNFTVYNDTARVRVAQLSSTGVLDINFGETGGANRNVTSITGVGADAYVVAGYFEEYQGEDRSGLARLDVAGNLDPDFIPVLELRGTVRVATPLADASLLIQGNISEFNGQLLEGDSKLVRHVRADGTLDPLYQTTATSMYGGQPNGTFFDLIPKLLNQFQLQEFQLQRILPSGAVDDLFASPLFEFAASTASLSGVITQADDRLLVFGSFATVAGNARNGIVRLLPNGSLDNSFAPPANSATRVVSNAFAQADGKVVVVYSEQGDSSRPGTFVERLNADGTLDSTFSIGTGAGPGSYFTVLAQPNGQLLVSGNFSTFNGQAAQGLVRLTTTGTVDNSFTTTVTDYRPQAVQADGRVLALAGRYSETALVRLTADGSLDQAFTPISLPQAIFIGDDFLSGLALQASDTKVILWGSFRSIMGQEHIGLARLNNAAVTTAALPAKALLPVEVYPNPAGQACTVLLPVILGAIHATLLDVHGREIRRYNWISRQSEATVDVSNLPAGIYVLRLAGTKDHYTQKLVVTH